MFRLKIAIIRYLKSSSYKEAAALAVIIIIIIGINLLSAYLPLCVFVCLCRCVILGFMT
jgi:type IV secretory pathway VirB2 component (pilin)